MQLKDSWQELGFKGECPLPVPSSEVIHFYQKQLDLYDKILAFKQDLVETLAVEQDGGVPEDRWEEVKKSHQCVYEEIMGAMESERNREDIKMMWPFDGVKVRADKG
ncbi:hypothetical protein D8B26_004039 [Coccidioides posadasii str. Silveira]|uniref:uncharacterized protein n=1 Tax=Coccidioides posadasii (strain RMSCC 757 / Silveira) TaxID=443226 RepID=UPI001BEFF6EE|nr:hypothetical protein D8B26_004039 [Coccidioides posadasii str. Silveira]